MERSRTTTKGPRRRRAPVVPSDQNVVASDSTRRERRWRGQAEQPRRAKEAYARDRESSLGSKRAQVLASEQSVVTSGLSGRESG
ncbi:hypothetical protein MA16_Dca011899 [Dendrobium catenatum]|uniref:Uncharacterized protein n=1 Tax=Dendrobium catenatum TaxID=906689 RepID=A0A2I0W2K1_9ASPA|nr:hypothetical protein MA16_Dca011899 [Dendrobium catenatum]